MFFKSNIFFLLVFVGASRKIAHEGNFVIRQQFVKALRKFVKALISTFVRQFIYKNFFLKKNVRNFLKAVKEEIYNTMNSYQKYKSIAKSSFYKMNILKLPINIDEKYLKYSIHFAYICDYQPLWI